MSLKPGAEALDELILQPESPSQSLEIIQNGPRVLPTVARSPHELPSQELDGMVPLKCAQKKIFFLYFICI